MSSSSALRTQAVPVREIATLPVAEWRAELLRHVGAGGRLVTLFGGVVDEGVMLTAVVDGTGGPVVLRARVTREGGYHALTEALPAAHIFEREIHEQLNVRIAGHPWLKSVRGTRDGHASPEGMAAYPYYVIEGKEVHEVAVGPVHAGVIEPGSFRFSCLGETVHHLEIQLGYQHRGVEELLRRGEPTRLGPWVETISGDSSVAHAWAYCGAIETSAGVAVSDATDAGRAILLELERVGMHLSGLAGLCSDVGFLQGATSYGRLRTTAINASMLLSGSRFGRGCIVPGRGRVKASAEIVEKLTAAVALLREDLEPINDCFLSSRTVQHRLQTTGVVTREQAHELGFVGMVARSCGTAMDQRSMGDLLKGFPVKVCVESDGDCWARATLRIAELDASLSWLSDVLGAVDLRPDPKPVDNLRPSTLVVSMVEGWRGEIVHCIETDSEGRVIQYRAQDPSLRNWMALAIAVRGNDISDFPICNKSFDLSYCGNDL